MNQARTSGAPYRTLHPVALGKTTPPLEWLVDGLFIKGGAGILGGAPKTGKSFFALDLAISVASATPCAGHFRVGSLAPVVLLSAEDPPAVVVDRLQALVHARGLILDQLPLHVIVEHPVRLPDNFDRLAATLAQHQPGLLLLDPLIRLHRADENSASEMSVILDGLRDLARSSRTAILLIHHSRKAAAGPSLGTALRGSSDLHAFGDSNLYLRRLAQDGCLELRIEHRAAAAPPPLRLTLTIDDHAARFQATDLHAQDHPHARRILELLHRAAEPVPSSVLRNKLGVRNQTLSEVLATLAAQGQVVRRGNSGWAVAGVAG